MFNRYQTQVWLSKCAPCTHLVKLYLAERKSKYVEVKPFVEQSSRHLQVVVVQNYTIYNDSVQDVNVNSNNSFSPENFQRLQQYTYEATVFEKGTGVSVKTKGSPSVYKREL